MKFNAKISTLLILNINNILFMIVRLNKYNLIFIFFGFLNKKRIVSSLEFNKKGVILPLEFLNLIF